MDIIDFNWFKSNQEVPRLFYQPFKVWKEDIFFEKIVSTFSREWMDGVYRWDYGSESMVRVDKGIYMEHPDLFNMQLFYKQSDMDSLCKHDKIYFSVLSMSEDKIFVTFYEIDTSTESQTEILTYSFSQDEWTYSGMEMLTDGYFFFRMTKTDLENKVKDALYLVNVYKNEAYEVKDDIMRMTYGPILFFESNGRPYVLVEESYLTEEEQEEFLSDEDLELLVVIPEKFNKDFVHRNSILLLDFNNMISALKKGETKFNYIVKDHIFMDGKLRFIGESKRYFYYKKAMYDFTLSKNDFISRFMIGKESVFSIDKNTFEVNLVSNESEKNIVFADDRGIYRVEENDECIDIVELDTDDRVISYEKSDDNEHFLEMRNDVLFTSVESENFDEYVKITDFGKTFVKTYNAEKYFILADKIFVMNMELLN